MHTSNRVKIILWLDFGKPIVLLLALLLITTPVHYPCIITLLAFTNKYTFYRMRFCKPYEITAETMGHIEACIYMYAYMCAYDFLHTCIRMHVAMCMCVHACVYASVCEWECVCMHVCVCTACRVCVCVCVLVCVRIVFVCVCVAYVCVCVCVCACVCMYDEIITHT